jgi:hypothetical protein
MSDDDSSISFPIDISKQMSVSWRQRLSVLLFAAGFVTPIRGQCYDFKN